MGKHDGVQLYTVGEPRGTSVYHARFAIATFVGPAASETPRKVLQIRNKAIRPAFLATIFLVLRNASHGFPLSYPNLGRAIITKKRLTCPLFLEGAAIGVSAAALARRESPLPESWRCSRQCALRESCLANALVFDTSSNGCAFRVYAHRLADPFAWVVVRAVAAKMRHPRAPRHTHAPLNLPPGNSFLQAKNRTWTACPRSTTWSGSTATPTRSSWREERTTRPCTPGAFRC